MTAAEQPSVSPLSDAEIKTLRSIAKGFTVEEWRILKSLASGIVGARNGGGVAPGGRTQQFAGPGAVWVTGLQPAAASDAELRSPYGDPEVRRDPKHWAGPSYVGAKYSACPSDYLLVLADSQEYFARKDSEKPEKEQKKHHNGTPFWKYNLQDAGRARGWARRNQGIAKPPPASVVDEPAMEPEMAAEDLPLEEPPIEEFVDELAGRM